MSMHMLIQTLAQAQLCACFNSKNAREIIASPECSHSKSHAKTASKTPSKTPYKTGAKSSFIYFLHEDAAKMDRVSRTGSFLDCIAADGRPVSQAGPLHGSLLHLSLLGKLKPDCLQVTLAYNLAQRPSMRNA